MASVPVAPTMRRALTPPQYAKQLGIDAMKVVAWIRSGELRAFNGATRRGIRPRYLITPEAIAAFEASRAVTPPVPQTRRRRRSDPDTIEFFSPKGEVLRTL